MAIYIIAAAFPTDTSCNVTSDKISCATLLQTRSEDLHILQQICPVFLLKKELLELIVRGELSVTAPMALLRGLLPLRDGSIGLLVGQLSLTISQIMRFLEVRLFQVGEGTLILTV